MLVDRRSRYYYYLEYLTHISQDFVIRALRKIFKDKRLGLIRSVTTDNETKFLDQDELQKILGCKVYYTRAYASYEKESIENANKMVRRWYPKGTNFAKVPKENLRLFATWINTIIRKLQGNRSAYEVIVLAIDNAIIYLSHIGLFFLSLATDFGSFFRFSR